jgi:hypothetical protein
MNNLQCTVESLEVVIFIKTVDASSRWKKACPVFFGQNIQECYIHSYNLLLLKYENIFSLSI